MQRKENARAKIRDWVMEEMQTNYFPKYSGAITSGSGGAYIVFLSQE